MLDDIASAAFAGGLGISAFKAVVPAGMVISATTTLSNWVWDTPPGDLKVQNERSLKAMGVSQNQVDLLLRQPYFTLTLQTRLVKALEKEVPFAGLTGSGTLVVAGPVDFLAWTERINRFATRQDLRAKQRILWLTGETTPRSRQELTGLGWTIQEKAINK
jgi:hypothetical protein